MRSMMTLALAAVAAAAPLYGQSIARRVSQVDEGTVRMSFAAREGICGRGTSIVTGPHSSMNWGDDWRRSSRDVEWDVSCDEGPVRIVLTVIDGDVAGIRTYVGGRWRPATSSTTDLGTVSAREAADFLVGLADRVPGKAGRDAIFPSTLADSATVWPALLRLARNEERPRQTRTQAVFWLGQMAGDKATEDLDALARDDGVNREVREQAIFALSQRPRDEGVPALIQIVRTSRDGELKKKALFWLGQSNDPRALALFEEILTKR
jgi:HEAT repeat protein